MRYSPGRYEETGGDLHRAAHQVLSINRMERGLLEFPRELPGLLLFFIAAIIVLAGFILEIFCGARTELMARAMYVKSLSDSREETTSTLSTGLSIIQLNHDNRNCQV